MFFSKMKFLIAIYFERRIEDELHGVTKKAWG